MPDPGTVISSLHPDEADALAALAREIWHTCYPEIISREQIDYMLGQRYAPPLIRQTLARGDRWLVAHAHQELIAFTHGYPLSESDYKLDKLYVHPNHQRQGVGAMLLARIATLADRRGCSRLVLRVNRRNARAIAAYLKYGFVIAAELREDIGGGFVMDDYVMIKEL